MAAKSNDTGFMAMLLIAGGGYLAYTKIIKPRLIVPIKLQENIKRLMPVMTMRDVRLTKKSIDFTIHIANPNPDAITIQAVVGTVHLSSNDGKTNYTLGMVQKFGNTIIKPVGETTVSLSIELKALPLLAYFSALVAGQIHGQLVSFSGTATIDNNPYPVNLKYQIA